MLANDRAHVDSNNIPLASLVAQEEHVDVNFIRNKQYRDDKSINQLDKVLNIHRIPTNTTCKIT
jgi:hypothetical protein